MRNTSGTQRRASSRRLCFALAATVALGGVATQAIAIDFELADQNSSLWVQVGNGTDGAKAGSYSVPGMFNWTVDGQDQMYQQWFWYRFGDSGPEQPLETLGYLGGQATDTNGSLWNPKSDLSPDTLVMAFGDPNGLLVEVSYVLRGAPAGQVLTADIGELITVYNFGTSAVEMSLFQYTDLDLFEDPEGDYVTIADGDARQWDADGLAASETVITPGPTHYEVALYDDILARLQDGDADDLADVGAILGPGDATWAFQWDFSISPDHSFQISKDKQITHLPEPVTMIGVAMGISGLAGYIRRRMMAGP